MATDRGPIRLAAISPLPIHYQAPLYRRLAADPRFDFTAFFASTAGVEPSDWGFGERVLIADHLVDGYRAEFLRGAQANPNFDSPWGLRSPDVVRRLVRGRFEALWLQGFNYAVYMLAFAAMRLRGAPTLFREEQTLIHPRGLLKTLAKELALRALFRRSYGLYIGAESKRWFEHYGIPAQRLFPTPYCADNGMLQQRNDELADQRDELKRSFGLPVDQPVFMTASRLIPKKQPLALLEAYRRARERVKCSLLIVGSGELGRTIREEIDRRQIPDVVLAGFLDQSEIPRAYASADAFVLFSLRDETWGVVVNEAMNFGLPLLVSDKVGSARDLVRDGCNGFVVPPEEIETLAARMAQLAADPALGKRMGQASLRLIENWNFDVAAQGLIDAVAAAVGRERWAQASAA
jgi:glycosyltransferase involved in cell wall biosynthesis